MHVFFKLDKFWPFVAIILIMLLVKGDLDVRVSRDNFSVVRSQIPSGTYTFDTSNVSNTEAAK